MISPHVDGAGARGAVPAENGWSPWHERIEVAVRDPRAGTSRRQPLVAQRELMRRLLRVCTLLPAVLVGACVTPGAPPVEAPAQPPVAPETAPVVQPPPEPPAPAPIAEVAPGPVKRPCDGFYVNGFKPAIGHDRTPAPTVPRPPKGKVFADPVYRTCVVRVTDTAHETMKTFARNDYSRRQPFNADDSLLLVYADGGSWHVYDARTMKYVKKLRGPGGDAEPQWHPTNPELLYFLPNNGGMTLEEVNVRTDERTVKADFTHPDSRGFSVRARWPDAARIWTRSEGSPSSDGRYWAFQVEDNDFKILGLLTYDLQTNTVLGAHTTSERPDNVSMSQSGKYVVVDWAPNGPEGGPAVFARDFTQRRRIPFNMAHPDLAVGVGGDDVLVGDDHTAGYVYMLNLRTWVRTPLFYIWPHDTVMTMHLSGKAYRKPGWILVSTFGKASTEWPHQKVFALQLKPNPVVVNLLHHRNVGGSYFAQPQAAVNRDFTRFVVNSNWGSPGDKELEVYMVEIPANAF
jgi:hypothetical protein